MHASYSVVNNILRGPPHLHEPEVLADDLAHGTGTRLQRRHHPEQQRCVANATVVAPAANPPLTVHNTDEKNAPKKKLR